LDVSGDLLTVTSAVVTITNSIVQNGGSYGIADHGGTPGEGHQVRIVNSEITGNGRAAVYTDDESADPILRNVIASGNGQDALVHEGSLSGDHRWENVGLPYVVEGNLSIYGGGLTIDPGVVVRMPSEGTIQVGGSLFAIGTITQPVTFTGPTEQPGSWGGIHYSGGEGSFLVLRYCDIGYGSAENQAMLRLYAPTAFVASRHGAPRSLSLYRTDPQGHLADRLRASGERTTITRFPA
jgi:hypothetical protein